MSNGTHKNTLELCSATTRNHHHSTTGSTEQATRGRATAEAERFMVQTRERGFWKTYGTKIQYGGLSWNSLALASPRSVHRRQSETIRGACASASVEMKLGFALLRPHSPALARHIIRNLSFMMSTVIFPFFPSPSHKSFEVTRGGLYNWFKRC